MKLALTILPRSVEEARALLRRRGGADLVELRVDQLPDPALDRILRPPRPPVIVTNRRRGEGGSFDGSPEDARALLAEALRLGAEYVDAELSRGLPFFRKLDAPARRLICSSHDMESMPADLDLLYRRSRATGAGIIKIAGMARTLCDNARMFRLMEKASADRCRFIGICMGESGEISRILGGKFGSYLTFAAPDGAEPAAPGQLTLSRMKTIFRAGTIGRRTRLFGLLGNPVRQSRGIYYHNARFHRRSFDAVYVNFLAGDAGSFFRAYGRLISGLSVTMPFKADVIAHLDRVDPHAAELGAVNTVVRRRGRLDGSNTDYPAVAWAVARAGSLRGRRAAVLGTGAMAATMAYAAVRAGARTVIFGRSAEKAAALSRRMGCSWALLADLPADGIDLLMNATSVGFQDPSSTPVPARLLRRGMTVVDAVSHPAETRLLTEARAAGCATVNGVEIFKHQAILQSRLFMEGAS